MNESSLTQRRNWFRAFPEGSIEFVIITRVLALLLLLLMNAVGGSNRILAVQGLAGLLWADYLLTMWWAVQVATDLNALTAKEPPAADALRSRRVRTCVLGMLPATACLLLVVALVPWPSFLPGGESVRSASARFGGPLMGILFLVSLGPAYRALRDARLGSGLWTMVLLIPIVHWFALHRLTMDLHVRLVRRSQESDGPSSNEGSPYAAILAADVTWVLTILPWVILLVWPLVPDTWRSESPPPMMPICGTLIAAVFAIFDVAAMENVQRRFVARLRRP